MEFVRHRAIKAELGRDLDCPLAVHRKPNRAHRQFRLDLPYTLRTTLEPLSPPSHRSRGRAVAVRRQVAQAHVAITAPTVFSQTVTMVRSEVSH